MPQPDVSDVHVNKMLSQISIGHMNALEAYIADKVFPFVYADKQTDIIPGYDRGFFFADEGLNMLRAPGNNAAVTGFKINKNNTYHADNFAIGFEIPDELRANQDDPFDMDQDGTRLVTELQMIRRERAWATDFMATGIWGTDVTGTTDFPKWSDYGASDPIIDIRTGIRTVLQNTGRKPNRLVLGN